MQALHQIRLPTPLQHSWTHFGTTCLDLFHTLCYSVHRFSGFWPEGWLIFLFTTLPQPSFLMFYIVSLAMTFAFLLTRVQILLWPDNFWVFWVKICQILLGPQDLSDLLKSVVPARLASMQLGQSQCKRERGRNRIKRKGAKGKGKGSHSVMSDSSRPHGLQPTRLLRPWDFPGKSTGMGWRISSFLLWILGTASWLMQTLNRILITYPHHFFRLYS